MKNSPLRPGKQALRRRAQLKRRVAIVVKNAKRRASRWVEAYGSKERVRAIQKMPCLVCGVRPSENAHAVSKAAGGTWRDIAPLCHAHHREQHRVGIKTFQATYNVDLHAIAARLAREIPA